MENRKMPELRETIDPCADECRPQIDQTQFAELYDMINLKVRTDLQDDFDCKKINGATFADTWAKIMSPAIGQIMNGIVTIQTKETAADRCVKAAQCSKMAQEELVLVQEVLNKKEQVNVMLQDIDNKIASEALTVRQTEGFDDNARQKLYEAQMNAWALMFSSGLIEEKPTHITNGNAGALAEQIRGSLGGSSAPDNPLGVFTQEVTATAESGGTTTVTWGSVSGASGYTLYASSSSGSLTGYPDSTVGANGSVDMTLIMPSAGQSLKYTFEIVAFDVAGQFAKVSSFNMTVSTPNP